MLNDLSSPIALLESRRSGKPRDMGAPGPSSAELDRILAVAARTPDHGKLAPWRFVVIEDRDGFARLLQASWRGERGDPQADDVRALEEFARQAPVLVAVISAPAVPSKIPVWEQQLSAGAAIMNLELAATALGYVAGWLTGWASDSPAVAAGLGLAGTARIAGYLYLGTPTRPLEERPRPALADVATRWRADLSADRAPRD